MILIGEIMKKNVLNYLILFFPILDFLTSIATWNSKGSLGLILKGIFFLYAIYYILKHTTNKKYFFFFLFLLSYIFLDFVYWYFVNSSALKTELIHMIKIFYFPVLILFFGMQKGDIFKKTVFLLFLEFLLLYLIPYPFQLGHNISEIYPNKNLYLSYFYIGNELANVFLLLIPTSFLYVYEENRRAFSYVIPLFLGMFFLLGTKTMYLSLVLIISFFLFSYRKVFFSKFKQYKWLFLGLSILIMFTFSFWFLKSNLYQNIKTQLQYYEIDTIEEVFSFQTLNHVIYSNRLTFLNNVHEEYKNASFLQKIMGLGRSKINEMKDIEIDIFDIFYSIGILGFAVYLFFIFFVLKEVTFSSTLTFTFVLLICISFFSGHVLLSPMTTSYLAILFGVNYRKDDEI